MTTAPTPRATTLQRLGTTPLRDILRFRLSGRLDVEPHLARLPAPLANLTRAVIKRTRLWRLEKVDIARELAAHFTDGLAAGRTPDQLIHDFGDPRAAAKLISRATKRKRPLPVKACLRTLQSLAAFLALCLLLYAALALRYFASHPTISHNYLADLNATIPAAASDQRAIVLYHQAWKMIGRPGPGEDLATLIRPGDPRWPAAVAYLHKHADALDLARRAASLPHLGAYLSGGYDPALYPEQAARENPYRDAKPMLISVLLPHLGELRHLTRHLIADMRLAAVEHDAPRLAADMQAILGIADHAREQPLLICDLVSLAILTSGLNEFGRILHANPELLSESQLIALAHRISACAGGGRLSVSFDGERAAFDDMLQRTFTDDGHGDGHPTADGAKLLDMLASSSGEPDLLNLRRLSQPIATAVMASRREQREAYDHLLDRAAAHEQRPLWEWGQTTDPDPLAHALESPTPLERLRYLPVEVMFPSTSYAALTAESTTQIRDTALVAIALTIHRHRTGSYPATLDALVPTLLPSIPPDRFDGQPIRYRLTDSGPILYSVGVDKRDDGGQRPSTTDDRDRVSHWISPAALAANLASPAAAYYRGDWLLWPMPIPAPPAITDPQ